MIAVHLRALAAVLVLGLAQLLAGCVIIPYKPAATTHQDPSAIANPERMRLTMGPHQLLEKMARRVLKENPRLQQVDGQAFIDAASPTQELTLARLLDPATRAQAAPLDVDYLVLFGQPVARTLKQKGDMILYLGFFGAASQESTSSYWAAMIDARQLQVLGQLTSESKGTNSGIGLFYGLFIVSDTDGSARDNAIRQVAATIASARPSGPVRVAFVAVEPIATAEEIAVQTHRAERERLLHSDRWSADFPPFAPAAPPPAGHALVYVYRPDTRRVPPPSILEFWTGPADAAGRMAPIRAARYYGFNAPAGELRIAVGAGVAALPTRSLTLQVESGKTYFVRVTVTGHLLGANEIAPSLVDADQGQNELRRCRRVPSSREYDEETRLRAEYGSLIAQLELSALLRAGTRYTEADPLAADPVEAYKWLEVARQRSDKYTVRIVTRDQETLARAMDAAQVAEAGRRARAWFEAPENQDP